MRRGLRIGRIGGIDISVDWSLLAIFWLVAWSLAVGQFPAEVPRRSTGAYWAAGIAAACAFILSLLAHELAHARVARRAGLQVRGIVLWVLGGVTEMSGEAPTAEVEFRVAVVGPLTSLALGASLGLVTIALHLLGAGALGVAACGWLALINGLLGLFNLAPALPLDGGRVLRAWLWRRSGDPLGATVRSARIGHRFGVALVAIGWVGFVLGAGLGGLWLAFIGLFILTAARTEGSRAAQQLLLRGVLVRDVMTPDPVVAPDSVTVQELIDGWAIPHRCTTFPLAGPGGAITGLVTLAEIQRVPPATRPGVRAIDVATPRALVVVCSPDDALVEVLTRLAPSPDQRALVMDRGALVGIVSPSDVARAADRAVLARRA